MSEKQQVKVALVTGGSKGIGRAICVELARSGYHLLVNYRSDEAGADETLSLIKNESATGEIIPFDVTNRDETHRAIKKITDQYASIDVLVNNAGITADGLFIMMPEKSWDTVIDTCLNGFFNVTKPILKQMVRQKRGAVVSISSVSGLMGNRGQANYSAAKAGIISASRAVASEVARLGIRVNVVAPGLIKTHMIQEAPVENIKNMIPLARIGEPHEVAKVVRFLCSDDASYVTGQVISVNGGMF